MKYVISVFTATTAVSLQESCRAAIQTEGIMEDLVKNLSRNNDELQMYCANAIFKVCLKKINMKPDSIHYLSEDN